MHVLLASGFRPFFLLAALHAAIAMPAWGCVLLGAGWPAPPLAPLAWHAHEMLYGFVMAAVAGFLLTAVPSWTGCPPVSGAALLALVLLWLLGRLVTSVPLGLGPVTVAVLDLAFVPALALAVVPPIVRARSRRNLVFAALLALLFVANYRFHAAGAATTEALLLAVNSVMVLVVLVGGRIVPAFTTSAFERRGIALRAPAHGILDSSAIAASLGVLVVDVLAPAGAAAGAVAALAAGLLALRLSRWHGHRTFGEPLLLVLHVGYAWLAIGLALKAVTLLAPSVSLAWVHALTAGGFSTMILAVMSRAALGHTGRPLVAPAAVVVGYALVVAGAAVRIVGPLAPAPVAAVSMSVAVALWSLGFVLFLAVYAPMLVRARIDGRPG